MDFLIKNTWRWIFIAFSGVLSIINFGFIAPYLISYENDIIVISGIAYLIIIGTPVLFAGIHVIYKMIKNLIEDMS